MKITTLWFVEKPRKESVHEDICWSGNPRVLENQFKGGLKADQIDSVWTEKSEAETRSKELLRQRDQSVNAEVEKIEEKYEVAAYLNSIGIEVVGMQIRLDDEATADLKAQDYGDAKGDEPEAKDLKRLADIEDKADGNIGKALQLATQMAGSIGKKDKAIRRAKAAKIAIQDKKLGKQIHDIFMKAAKNLAA